MGILSRLVDRTVNRTAHHGRLAASEQALDIHRRVPIVDLLVGSVLFRDSFVQGGGGMADLPRLQAVGVRVVGLTIATRFPDVRGTLSNWHFRSLGATRATLKSDMAIADWLVGRIEGWCAESSGRLSIVRSKADLETVLATAGAVGAVIVAQGGHVLENEPANVRRLGQLGVRVLAPAHVMDNLLVGSGTGRRAGGLSDHGREVVAELEAQRIIVDLAHMSTAGIEATMPLLHAPFLISHTGIREVAGGHNRWRRYSAATRNIPASIVAEAGRRGGLVGVILASQLVGGDIPDVVATVSSALAAARAGNVAIGSDMDGALRSVVDAEGLPAITTALLESGLDQSVVEGVVGRNAIDFLRRALPD